MKRARPAAVPDVGSRTHLDLGVADIRSEGSESSRALPWPLSSLRCRGLDVTRPIF